MPPLFWASLIIGAFQPANGADFDPDVVFASGTTIPFEDGISGETPGSYVIDPFPSNVSAIYLEVIREIAAIRGIAMNKLIELIVAHEVAHAAGPTGRSHADTGLLGESPSIGDKFDSQTLRDLRGLSEW